MTAGPATTLGPDSVGLSVGIDGRRISTLGESTGGDASEPLDCRDTTLQPGHVNAHTHVYSGLAPLGVPPPEPEPEHFVHILERLWWRLDRALDEPSLRASAFLYIAEALLAGTTTLIDHHESPSFIEGSLEVLGDVCQELGMRAVLTYGATERNGGPNEAQRGLDECRRFITANRRPLVRGVVGLHASFTVSDETIRAAGELCRELDTILHVHLAEDVADIADARRRSYRGPLERLLDLDALPAGSILAHGVHLGPDQVQRAADAGCWLVQNARSNRGNGVGYPRFLGVSDRVAMGTDGYPSSMPEEKAVLAAEAVAQGDLVSAAEQRVTGGYRLVAELFGLPFSPLAAGGAADLAAFPLTEERPRHVIVAGKTVVRDGVLLTGDFASIRANAEAQAPLLWERMRSL